MAERRNRKIIAIHQPNYLPWLGYFFKIFSCNVFVFLDTVQFSTQSYTSRVAVKNNRGEKIWLSVPILKKGLFGQNINEVKINYNEKWVKKHLATLYQNYSHTMCMRTFFPLIEEIITNEYVSISELNIALITKLTKLIFAESNVEFVRASNLGPLSGNKSHLLCEICSQLNADVYLSGSGAKSYNDKNVFDQYGIELKYYDFVHPVYEQTTSTFLEGLSIIDLIFNCGQDTYKILVDKNHYVQ